MQAAKQGGGYMLEEVMMAPSPFKKLGDFTVHTRGVYTGVQAFADIDPQVYLRFLRNVPPEVGQKWLTQMGGLAAEQLSRVKGPIEVLMPEVYALTPATRSVGIGIPAFGAGASSVASALGFTAPSVKPNVKPGSAGSVKSGSSAGTRGGSGQPNRPKPLDTTILDTGVIDDVKPNPIVIRDPDSNLDVKPSPLVIQDPNEDQTTNPIITLGQKPEPTPGQAPKPTSGQEPKPTPEPPPEPPPEPTPEPPPDEPPSEPPVVPPWVLDDSAGLLGGLGGGSLLGGKYVKRNPIATPEQLISGTFSANGSGRGGRKVDSVHRVLGVVPVEKKTGAVGKRVQSAAGLILGEVKAVNKQVRYGGGFSLANAIGLKPTARQLPKRVQKAVAPISLDVLGTSLQRIIRVNQKPTQAKSKQVKQSLPVKVKRRSKLVRYILS